MNKMALLLLMISIISLYGCQSNSKTVASGECPVGEPNCKDVVVDLPIDGDEKEVLPGCVGDDCTVPPATEDRNTSKPPASQTPTENQQN